MPEHQSYPGPPVTPEPPEHLVRLADALSHPEVAQTGLTTTSGGEWALMVRVHPGVSVPIQEIERAAEGHPVVYQEHPGTNPVARPAYPALGE